MQRELKESEGKAENMMKSKATTEQQKKDADSNYATLWVFVCMLYCMHDKMCVCYIHVCIYRGVRVHVSSQSVCITMLSVCALHMCVSVYLIVHMCDWQRMLQDHPG